MVAVGVMLALLGPAPALADWQATLEAHFTHAITFDDLDDWNGRGAGSGPTYGAFTDPSRLPGNGATIMKSFTKTTPARCRCRAPSSLRERPSSVRDTARSFSDHDDAADAQPPAICRHGSTVAQTTEGDAPFVLPLHAHQLRPRLVWRKTANVIAL